MFVVLFLTNKSQTCIESKVTPRSCFNVSMCTSRFVSYRANFELASSHRVEPDVFELFMPFHHINDVGESVHVTQHSTHETVNSIKTDYFSKVFTIVLSSNHSGFHPDFSCSAIPDQF